MRPLVEVSGLHIAAVDGRGVQTPIVKDVSFDIAPGEVLALIGQSGSGKTTIALSLMGYARDGTRITAGSIKLDGTELRGLPARALQQLHGRDVAYVPQSAAASFNPSRRLMPQVIESAVVHGLMTRREAEAKAIALFAELALPDPANVGNRYPHQVSGGQLQRLIAAMALLTSPRLVIFDEPTTALDVTTQIGVLRAFKRVVREHGVTALYVSHDLAVVAQIADRILVLNQGEMQEIGEAERLISAPSHAYTRSLMAAARPPELNERPAAEEGKPLLQVSALTAGYGRIGTDGMPLIPVLHDISFTVPAGHTLGIVGESGSGKSTLARVIAGLLPQAKGTVTLDGATLPPSLARRTRDQLRQIQFVHQMADTALNPSHTVAEILGRPLTFFGGLRGRARDRAVAELLDMVRLPAVVMHQRPASLSGGQKQRANLARALAARPRLLLCDEVTSALDSVVGAAVLKLLAELQSELGLSYVFISHDISTVRAICDQVMVLYAGQMMERGVRRVLSSTPRHPYSDLLVNSVPELRTGWLDEIEPAFGLESEVTTTFPNARACAFFPHCSVHIPGRCERDTPPIQHLSKGADIRCHRSENELRALAGTAVAAEV